MLHPLTADILVPTTASGHSFPLWVIAIIIIIAVILAIVAAVITLAIIKKIKSKGISVTYTEY